MSSHPRAALRQVPAKPAACWVLDTMTAALCAIACAAAISALVPMYSSHSHACSYQETCKICFESFPVADMHCARCKHYYCKASHQAMYLVAAWHPAADCQLPQPWRGAAAADAFRSWRHCLHCCWHVRCCWHGRCSAVVTVPVPLTGLLHSSPQDCWRGYIQTAIDSGPSCLDLRCPDPGAALVCAGLLLLRSLLFCLGCCLLCCCCKRTCCTRLILHALPPL